MANNHNKEVENKYGQFFTSDRLSKDMLNIINNIKKIEGDILEPSFGGGIFIKNLKNYNYNTIDGYEIDENVFNDFEYKLNGLNLYLDDFLLNNVNKTYDHIIGNPPYVEINYSYYNDEQIKSLKDEYSNYCDGRVNLVHMFIVKSFNVLNNGGLLSFLLPNSILTSPYYKSLRKFIHTNFNIECIINDTDFEGVGIGVSLLILKKCSNPTMDYIVNYNDNYFFTEKYLDYPIDIKTLKEENFQVKIGNIVWNQHKDKLSDDSTYNPLIYSKNLDNNKLNFDVVLSKSNTEKKQYIIKEDIKFSNFIALPRTFNKNNSTKAVLIENNTKYQLENHILVIMNDDIDKLRKLYDILVNEKLIKYIDLFNTSSSLSATEVLSLPFEE